MPCTIVPLASDALRTIAISSVDVPSIPATRPLASSLKATTARRLAVLSDRSSCRAYSLCASVTMVGIGQRLAAFIGTLSSAKPNVGVAASAV